MKFGHLLPLSIGVAAQNLSVGVKGGLPSLVVHFVFSPLAANSALRRRSIVAASRPPSESMTVSASLEKSISRFSAGTNGPVGGGTGFSSVDGGSSAARR